MQRIDSLKRMVMRLKGLSKDFKGAANTLVIVLIGLLMVSASTVVIMLYQGGGSEPSATGIAEVGNTVKVDYIGKLTDGRVFDTSFYAIAINDAAYPKSLSFVLRTNTSYVPLTFAIGGGQMIAGFDAAVVGMRIGETKTVELSPSEAYGYLDPTKLIVFDLVQELPLFDTMSFDDFTNGYGAYPVQGLTVSDSFWGWPVTVLEANSQTDQVTIQNAPTLDAEYRIFSDGNANIGWNVKVTSMDSNVGDSGIIVIENLLTPEDNDMIKAIDPEGTTFFIMGIDLDAGIAVANYNTELVGKTLVFTITLNEIVE